METTSQQPVLQSPSGLPDMSVLLRSAFDLFKKKMRSLMKIAAFAFVLQLALSIITLLIGAGTFFGASSVGTGNSAVGGGIFGVGILLLLGMLVVYALLYAWIQATYILNIRRDEADPDMHAIVAEAKPLIMPIWGVSILAGLIIVAGFILLVIPGIIFSIWYSFAVMIVVLEGIRGNAALKQSKQYVRGRWWAIFGRIFVLFVIMAIISAIVNGIFGGLGDYVGTFLSDAVSAFILVPFALCYQYLLYRAASRTVLAPMQMPDQPKPIA